MEKWKSFTKEEIKDFLKKSKTKKQFAEFLGYVKISSKTWDKLKIAYPEINFDIFKTGYVDLTGQKFGKLTVIGRDYSNKKATMWLCLCDCGTKKIVNGYNLKRGLTKSCGCLQKEVTSALFTEDLTGKKFGKWFVVERDRDKKNGTYWICECECGTIKSVKGSHLKDGFSLSCGCVLKNFIRETKLKDLTGKKFGDWNVLYLDEEKTKEKGAAYWYCRCCICNRIHSVYGANLRSGKSTCCRNCIKSKQEEFIDYFLLNNNFSYKREVSFSDLVSSKGKKLRFDFIIYENNIPIIAIEYQGEQHYQAVPHWGGEEALAIRKQNDQLKEQYCKDNQIKLITIPYWDKEIIEEKYLKPLLI